jgi:hypothetical protein
MESNQNVKITLDPTIFKMPTLEKIYTVTNEKDKEDIENGRCPDYALYWPEEVNKKYWPTQHNYYKGFDKTSEDESKTNEDKDEDLYYTLWRQISVKIAEKKALPEPVPIIFCSLSLLVCNIDDDRTKLNLSTYGRKLWEIIKELHPFITVNNQHYTKDKKDWCELKLKTINIVNYDIVREDEKYIESPYILIDYEDIKDINNQKKVFIQYTNINETLSKILINI